MQIHTSTQKIVAGLLGFAMVLTLVVGLSVAPVRAADAYNYTKNLTIGSRGADVVALQTLLVSEGYLTMPEGVAMGYFGSLTKKAVAAFQAANGITPAAGYFGAITRAYVASMGGTTGGTTSTVPGCTAGAKYSSTTGQPCTTSTGGSTSTTEGTLDVTLAGSPANNANITSNTDVPVYGINLRSRLGDVTVDRMDLKVGVTAGATVENPANFINTIKVWDGSTVVKSYSVGSSDFVKDSNGNYYIRLSGVGFVVPKDQNKNLVVSFSTNGGIDTSRVVTIDGYLTNSLRVTSAGVTSYYDISALDARTQTFQKPGIATLTVSADANSPISQNYEVTSSSGISGVTLQTFAVKATDGDAAVTSVSITSAHYNTPASTLYLYSPDGTLFDSRTAATSTTFTNNSGVIIPKDTTKIFTIKADFPSGTVNATVASTTVTSVSYDKPNGTSATVSTTIAGNNQYFSAAIPQFTVVGTPTAVSAGTNTSGSTTAITGTFTIKVKPVGGSMTQPTVSDFIVKVGTTTSPYLTVADGQKSISISPTPSNSILAENNEYTITLTATEYNADLPANGVETFYVTSIASSVNSVSTTQTWGLDSFKTSPVTFVK